MSSSRNFIVCQRMASHSLAVLFLIPCWLAVALSGDPPNTGFHFSSFFFFFFFFFSSSSSNIRPVYVDPLARAGGDGSSQLPFATIKQAVNGKNKRGKKRRMLLFLTINNNKQTSHHINKQHNK